MNGACFIAAVLGGLACLDLEGLKLLQCLRGVDWVAVKRWADYGRTIKQEDRSCCEFRESMLPILWNQSAEVACLFSSDPTIDLDVNRVEWSNALGKAERLGFNLEACSSNDSVEIRRVKRWAVALLGPTVQATEAVMQAFFRLQFQNLLGFLVLTRTEVT
jgi:hypothetical protein